MGNVQNLIFYVPSEKATQSVQHYTEVLVLLTGSELAAPSIESLMLPSFFEFSLEISWSINPY